VTGKKEGGLFPINGEVGGTGGEEGRSERKRSFSLGGKEERAATNREKKVHPYHHEAHI